MGALTGLGEQFDHQDVVAQLAARRDPGASTLVATKLTLPGPRRQAIRRDRLDDLLAAGLESRLTLVAAPAGFGKTTLVSEWWRSSASPHWPVTWVSLDKRDSDPSRFWAYVRAGLDCSGVRVGSADADERGASRPGDALAELVNALAGLTHDHVLVLDDYHAITDVQIHEDLAFLIQQQPPRFHLVILTRSDPPLRLARWRVNGEMVDIRARDLAFDRYESQLFLAVNGVDLTDELREALFARLEGWAAALRLVTLWVADSDDPSRAVAEFAAGDATIADYLTAEVLDHLPDTLRRFLLWTSILPRMSGELCDAVTGESDGHETLLELERRHLFVEPLDRDREWFRYHQLFDELLRHELRRQYPHMRTKLHLRASQWFSAHGFAADAIDHRIAAEDWPGVKVLLLAETLALGSRYETSVIAAWLSMIPELVLDGSPFFLLLKGFVLSSAGDFAAGKRALDTAETVAHAVGYEPEPPGLRALVYTVRGAMARLECDLPTARRSAQEIDDELAWAAGRETPIGRLAHVSAQGSVATAMYWHGDELAQELLCRAQREAATHGLARMRLNATSMLALAQALDGHLTRADQLATDAAVLADEIGSASSLQTIGAYLARALLTLERGEHASARRQLERVRDQARRHADRACVLIAGVRLAQLSALDGDVAGAFAILGDVQRPWPRWQPPVVLQALLYEQQVRLCLLVGDIPAAHTLHAQIHVQAGDPPAAVGCAVRLSAARLLAADGHPAQASALSLTVADAALAAGQLTYAVEASLFAALACHAAGQAGPALAALDRALTVAQTEDMIGPFVREASVVRPLLLKMQLGASTSATRGFRQRLLAAMGVPASVGRAGRGPVPGHALTERELTVLRMLSGTLSNHDIAAALSVSPNTLKSHIKHVYSKLEAKTRRDAIVRARELDLI